MVGDGPVLEAGNVPVSLQWPIVMKMRLEGRILGGTLAAAGAYPHGLPDRNI